MPDDNNNLLRFEPGPRSKQTGSKPNGRQPPPGPKGNPEDMIAAGGVVLALALAVAMVSGWVPIDAYTIGIVACAAAGAVIAKLVQQRRRPKAPVTKLPRRDH